MYASSATSLGSHFSQNFFWCSVQCWIPAPPQTHSTCPISRLKTERLPLIFQLIMVIISLLAVALHNEIIHRLAILIQISCCKPLTNKAFFCHQLVAVPQRKMKQNDLSYLICKCLKVYNDFSTDNCRFETPRAELCAADCICKS